MIRKRGWREKAFSTLVLIVTLFPVCAFLFAGNSGTVHAAQATPAQPLTTACSFTCIADLDFGSVNIHGSQTDMTVDDPGGSNFNWYEKFIRLQNGNNDQIEVGESHNFPCPSTYGLSYFYEVTDADNSTNNRLVCMTMNTNDVNHPVTLALSYYVSNGGGAFFFIYNTWSGFDPCPLTGTCSIANPDFTGAWTMSEYWAELTDSAFTTHEVWGGDWVNNKYFAGGSWNYDATSGTTYPNNPMQMYWPTGDKPNGSTNNGGTLFSCAYPSGTSCILGR